LPAWQEEKKAVHEFKKKKKTRINHQS